MPSACVAEGCRNKGGHFFPKDPVLSQKWLAAVNRPRFVLSKHSRLCSAHFRESDFVTEGYFTGLPLKKKCLKKDAVPSVFNTKEFKKPPDDPLQCAGQRQTTSATAEKRKPEEPITSLCMKSNKVILLIQDPDYGQSTPEPDDVSEAFCEEIEKLDVKVEPEKVEDIDPLSCAEFDEESADENKHGISVENRVESNSFRKNQLLGAETSIFEYDVKSRPSLREVSSKSQSGDAAQDRVYTSEQRDVVIDKLNSVRTDENVRKLLGLKLTKSIESYLHANGSFSKLDELLSVQSVGPKTVRTLCDKLLGIIVEKAPRSRSTSPVSSSSSSGRRSRSPAHLVSPPLTEEFCLSVNLLGAVIVDVTSISWAMVDCKKKTLIDWKTLPVDVLPSSLHDVVVKAAAVEKELPEADLFVLEDPSIGTRGGHFLNSHFTCALATLIHTQRKAAAGDVRMALMKNRLVEKHFSATVGSETVSLQPFLQDIIDQKVVVGRSNIFISQDLIKYYKGLDSVNREQLSRAGLLSVTCIDLVLCKRDVLDRRK